MQSMLEPTVCITLKQKPPEKAYNKAIKGHKMKPCGEVSEQILNGTSAQLGCTVPFTSVQD